MTNIHFIGIGGIGVSALAKIYENRGAQVSGSDMHQSSITETFTHASIGHKSENVTADHDLVIYSPAIPADNVELLRAKELGIPTKSYPEALGDLSREYFTIAIAGTHGKSTTTAMLALILEQAGLDPTVVVGTKIPQFDGHNYRVGESKYLNIEACEYRESFHSLHPKILLITNIEPDHLDFFKTAENYHSNFQKFIANLPPDSQTFQHPITLDFDATPGVPGDFNLENAQLAARAALALDISPESIQKALKSFTGTWRRMEEKPKLGNTRMIDDYAHHPTEIQKTLAAIRHENPEANILTVFQPHQYSRTKHFLEEFANSFTDSDAVIIPDIYAVRDSQEDLNAVSPADLVAKIGDKAMDGHGLEETAKYLRSNHQNYDIIITMGAGNIYKIYSLI